MSQRIDILLATYNAGQYLSAQFDSLLSQKFVKTQILVGDDGSKDNTLTNLHSYAESFPERIQILPEAVGGSGACANFGRLLGASKADYVFLSDQDDVWDEDKLEISMHKMLEMESEFGSEMPLLVHTDLRVVDQNLGLISPSLFELQRLGKLRSGFKELLCQNVVTGCTVLVNRALIDKALPIPQEAVMHDWWLALVASAFGKVGFVDRATMSYRQHGANTIGAKAWSLTFVLKKLSQLMRPRAAAGMLRPVLLQASAFNRVFGSALSQQDRADVSGYVSMYERSSLKRLQIAINHGFRKQGALRTLGFYWALLIADFHD